MCAGAGAILAMASDLRLATPEAKTAFLFTRVGLSGADMGACGILPRIIGQGRATELLLTGRAMTAAEGQRWGFYNTLHSAADLETQALALARSLADGPWLRPWRHQDHAEPGMGHEPRRPDRCRGAGAGECMTTGDFRRAFEAFAAKSKPRFEGN